MVKELKTADADRFAKAVSVFRRNGNILNTTTALSSGIHPTTLYQLHESGIVERLVRGLYRLVDIEPLGNPDFVIVSRKAPKGVICLLSALAFYELTTHIPHAVQVAFDYGVHAPKMEFPPVEAFHFSNGAFTEGVDILRIDGVDVKIYALEKTLADCFKFRNKIGMDTVIESLHFYRKQRKTDIGSLMRYAEICRVKDRMKPYLEALL